MGDRAPATFSIYNTAGKEEAIFAIFERYGFLNGDWDRAGVGDVRDGATFNGEEQSLGILEELGRQLEALGVSYRGAQDAKYEFDGAVRFFTPELGSEEFIGNNEGFILVEASDVTKIANRLSALCETGIEGTWSVSIGDIATVIVEISKLTGQRYVDAFKALSSP